MKKQTNAQITEERNNAQPRSRGGVRKRLISMINRADDRQIMKLYEYAHRMMRDSVE